MDNFDRMLLMSNSEDKNSTQEIANQLSIFSLDNVVIDDINDYESCLKNIKKEEPYFDYDKSVSGKTLHLMRIKTPANQRELLSLENISNKQRCEIDHCGTLCWCCQHALDLQCEWFQGFRLVPGWVAIAKTVSGIGRSYMIYDCPKYTPTESRKQQYQKGKDSTNHGKSLFEENIKNYKNKRFVRKKQL